MITPKLPDGDCRVILDTIFKDTNRSMGDAISDAWYQHSYFSCWSGLSHVHYYQMAGLCSAKMSRGWRKLRTLSALGTPAASSCDLRIILVWHRPKALGQNETSDTDVLALLHEAQLRGQGRQRLNFTTDKYDISTLFFTYTSNLTAHLATARRLKGPHFKILWE